MGVGDEIAGVQLGDARLAARAVSLVETLAVSPEESFPDRVKDDSELEALYRFVNNERVSFEGLLAPHVQATASRAAAAGQVLVLHDTTTFSFGGETPRRGLGRIKKGGQGFSAHTGLVVRASDGEPLGVVGAVPVVRDAPLKPRAATRAKVYDHPREFERWGTLVDQSIERLPGCTPIHVMDREADAYPLFCKLRKAGQDFVIRCKDDRVLDVPHGDKTRPRHLYDAVDRAPLMLTREVELSTKRPDRMARLRKTRGRMMRTAFLRVTATSVDVRHPPYTAGKSRTGSDLPRAVPLNVVHVYEVDTPEGQEPVEWLLYTTLSVEMAEQVAAVIDHYRRRWLIEEYFKALKTGCAYEKRQLESKHALLNALGLFIPIAWRLLTLRYLARETPNLSALRILSARQLEILRARDKVSLSAQPTVREAMLAVAAEGGHIKNNGEPGWRVLARGYEQLLQIEIGYVLGQARRRWDQS